MAYRFEHSLSVVMPVYGDGASLRELYRRLRDTLQGQLEHFELIFVDDGSPDDSWQIMRDLAEADSRVKAIRLSRNFGQHPAIAAGFERATGDVIVLMDSDLQDRPEDIPTLLAGLSEQYDIVYTVKDEEPPSLPVRITSRLYHYVFSRLTRSEVPIGIGTFRAFSRKCLEALLAHREYRVLFGPLMFYVGFESQTIKVVRDSRAQGESTYTFRKRLALAVDSLMSYNDFPMKLLFRMGGAILTFSILYSIAIVVGYVFYDNRMPEGLNLIVFLLTVTLGVNMLGMGIIGAYVFRVYEEVLRRPRYIVSNALNVSAPDERTPWTS